MMLLLTAKADGRLSQLLRDLVYVAVDGEGCHRAVDEWQVRWHMPDLDIEHDR